MEKLKEMLHIWAIFTIGIPIACIVAIVGTCILFSPAILVLEFKYSAGWLLLELPIFALIIAWKEVYGD